jgi:hypothetical protein
MEYSKTPRKVKLKTDLTKYDSRCKVGELGETIPFKKFSNFGNFDCFVAIKFDNGAKMDVAINSLEFI